MAEQLAFDLYAQAPTAASPTPVDPNWRLLEKGQPEPEGLFDWMQMKDGTIYVRPVPRRAS